MSSEPFGILVSRLLEGDLNESEKQDVLRQVEQDSASRKEYNRMRTTVELVRSLGEEMVEAPASMMAGIRDALNKPPLWKRWAQWLVGGPLLTPARGLAFVFMAAIIGGVLVVQPYINDGDSPTMKMAHLENSVIPAATEDGLPAKARMEIPKSVGFAGGSEKGPEGPNASEPTVAAIMAGDNAVNDESDTLVAVASASGSGLSVAEVIEAEAPAPLERNVLASRPAPTEDLFHGETARLEVSPNLPPRLADEPAPPSPMAPLPVVASMVVFGPQPTFGGFMSAEGVTAGVPLAKRCRRSSYSEPRDTRGAESTESVTIKLDSKPAVVEEKSSPKLDGVSSKGAGSAGMKTENADQPASMDCKRLIRKSMKNKMAGTEHDPEKQPVSEGKITFEKENFIQEYKGAYSGLKERATFIIEDAEEWKKIWNNLTSIYSPPQEVPEIDFARNFAVGVALGEKTSGGYAITIGEIELVGKRLQVIVNQTEPGPGSSGGMTLALTQPYHILILPRHINGDTFNTKDGFKVEFIYQ